MTNHQLAKGLGLKLTVTRNKCRELGLKRIEMEYWTKEQVEYLAGHYKTTGDVELAAYFQKTWPKKKKWTKQHINKKRKYLKLLRTKAQQEAIITKNVSPGGNSHTITKNSSSINMHPSWVVQRMAWRDKELQQEILKNHPQLVETGKALILLKRAIKKQQANGR
jgi:nitrate reductase alpha subunit